MTKLWIDESRPAEEADRIGAILHFPDDQFSQRALLVKTTFLDLLNNMSKDVGGGRKSGQAVRVLPEDLATMITSPSLVELTKTGQKNRIGTFSAGYVLFLVWLLEHSLGQGRGSLTLALDLAANNLKPVMNVGGERIVVPRSKKSLRKAWEKSRQAAPITAAIWALNEDRLGYEDDEFAVKREVRSPTKPIDLNDPADFFRVLHVANGFAKFGCAHISTNQQERYEKPLLADGALTFDWATRSPEREVLPTHFGISPEANAAIQAIRG